MGWAGARRTQHDYVPIPPRARSVCARSLPLHERASGNVERMVESRASARDSLDSEACIAAQSTASLLQFRGRPATKSPKQYRPTYRGANSQLTRRYIQMVRHAVCWLQASWPTGAHGCQLSVTPNATANAQHELKHKHHYIHRLARSAVRDLVPMTSSGLRSSQSTPSRVPRTAHYAAQTLSNGFR